MDTSPLLEDISGGWFDWKMTTGPNGEFQIIPRRSNAVVFAVPIAHLLVLAVVWLSRTEWQMKIVATVIGIAACITLTAFLAWHNRREQQIGPFLVFDGKDLVLRHARQVPMSQVAHLEVLRRWECTGDGITYCYYLILHDAEGQTFPVISSWDRRGIRKARAALEDRLTADGWTARPIETENHT